MATNKTSATRQHEPLRIPAGWEGQERHLVNQIELLMDDIYRRLGKLREEVKELTKRVEDLE